MKSRQRKQKPRAIDQLDLFARPMPASLAAGRAIEAPPIPAERPQTARAVSAPVPQAAPAPSRPSNVPEALIDYVLGAGRQRGRPEKPLHVGSSMPGERRLLDVREAATRLGLSKSTLDKMRCIGSGPRFIRATDRAIRYDPADLDAFANERRRRSTSEEALAALGS